MANQRRDEDLTRQPISALRKPWDRGTLLSIPTDETLDAIPTWQTPDQLGIGGGGGPGTTLNWVEMQLFAPAAAPVGSFGNPAVAIDGDKIYLSGAVAVNATYFQNGAFYGYLDTSLYPEINTQWPPVVGTRRYGGPVFDMGSTNPEDIRTCIGLMSNTGDGKLRFGVYVTGFNAAQLIGGTIFQDNVVRFAPPATSP